MGYETKLIFITGRKRTGYQSDEASLEMGKVCNDEIGDLIGRLRMANRKNANLSADITEWENEHNRIYTQAGNYTPEVDALQLSEQKKATDALFKMERILGKKLPFFYGIDGNTKHFEDSCGDLLLVADIEELLAAIRKDAAGLISNGQYGPEGYRRFNVAIAMLEQFRKERFGETVRVVLWGH